MKPSQLKLLKQFDPSRKSYGGTVSVSYPSWVWGGAPAANDFGVIHIRKEAFGAIYWSLFSDDFWLFENRKF